MFVSESKLPHILCPGDYYKPEAFACEQELLRKTWHVVGTTPEFSKPGDFRTLLIAGEPIQVRNFNGELHALSNVCAHRHALICSRKCGNSDTMRCQYHGWEYQEDGATGRIPQPKNFVPFDREALRLRKFQLATVGQLVFVNLSENTPSLREFLGPEFYRKLEERFSDEWVLSLRWEPQYPVNWKVPVENSLEAYHVPAVHPKTFREDPGNERSEHGFKDHRSWFTTRLPFSPYSRLDSMFQRTESRFVRWLGVEGQGRYEQHHVYPNLLFSFTDAISLCNILLPQDATNCQAIVRQFGRMPVRVERGSKVGAAWSVKRLAARSWARLTAAITKRILNEDRGIFQAIQSGLEHSSQAGVLGRCEERIHAFQLFMAQATGKVIQ